MVGTVALRGLLPGVTRDLDVKGIRRATLQMVKNGGFDGTVNLNGRIGLAADGYFLITPNWSATGYATIDTMMNGIQIVTTGTVGNVHVFVMFEPL